MLLIVLSALMGASFGLSGRSAPVGAMLAGGLATAVHYGLTYALGFLIAFAPNRYAARHLVEKTGLLGPSLTVVVGAAVAAAIIAALLNALVSSPDEKRNDAYAV